MFQAFVWEAGQRGLTAEKLSSCNGSPAQPPLAETSGAAGRGGVDRSSWKSDLVELDRAC